MRTPKPKKGDVLTPDSKAPDFSLTDTDGRAVSLASLTAMGTTLLVFVEEDCPTSRMSLSRLQSISEGLADAGVSIVAIHQNDAATSSRTMRRCRADFAALVEEQPYAVSSAFDVATVPTAYLIDRDAKVLRAVEGWCTDDFNDIADAVASDAGVAAVHLGDEAPRLKPGCASKSALDPSLWATPDTDVEFDVVEDLFDRGWTDGLPVVPPTRERVDRMLDGRNGATSLGPVPPGMGELTLERLASCAVLAGCHPSYFPVVRAAADAVLDPDFNLHGMTNTTHTSGVVLFVNGPIRAHIGMNSGINCMGGWNRANATIGRAIRLVSGLTGSGRPPKLDRSTMGQPGKISFCFAENEEDSPWDSFSVTRGFSSETSTVTAYCGDAPFTVSDHYSQAVEDVVATIGLAGAAIFSPNVFPIAADTIFVLSLEHARMFASAGWSKAEVAQRIYDVASRRAGDITIGERSPFHSMMAADDIVSKWTGPEQIHLLVSGGPAGRFSAILPPWVGFGLGSTMTTRAIGENEE
jgi:peroxiredoxin